MKRPWFIILKMANIKRVTARHPMSTKQAVRVTPSANALSLSSISGIGRGVGVVGGGTNGSPNGNRKVLVDAYIQLPLQYIKKITSSLEGMTLVYYLCSGLPLQLNPFDIHIHTRDWFHCFCQCILLHLDRAIPHKDLKKCYMF